MVTSLNRTTPVPGERRPENRRVARHREPRERLSRRARQRVQHVRLAGRIDDVVEERAEVGAGERRRLVGDGLDHLLRIQFRRDGDADPLERVRDPLLLAGAVGEQRQRRLVGGDVQQQADPSPRESHARLDDGHDHAVLGMRCRSA